MENYGFGTVLLVWSTGVLFIILSIACLLYGVYHRREMRTIKDTGHFINATIDIKSKNEDTVSYWITYTVDEKKYTYTFESYDNSYQKGDSIEIAYLEKDPNKVYVSIERDFFAQVVPAISFFLILGMSCVMYFNIFKYKSVIEVT